MNVAYGTYTDDALLALWKQKDGAAFECFYKRYFLKLVNTAVRKVHDQQVAEELVQDVFVVLYSNSNGVNDNPGAYAHRVLKYKIADYYRKHTKIMAAIAADEITSGGLTDTSSHLEYKELERQLEQAVMTLPDQCQRVFLLRREANLTNQEVAEKLGISVKTVEAHMSKALRTLREHIDYAIVIGIVAGLV